MTLTQDTERADERSLLRDAAARYIERDYSFEQRRARQQSAPPDPDPVWMQFAEMGWLALGAPEDCGGFGDAHDAAIVAEALGRAQALEPWLAQIGLCQPLLSRLHAGADLRAGELLGRMGEGRLRVALAAWEPQGRHDAFDIQTTAQPIAEGRWQLDGRKTLVLGGAQAHTLLVVARESGAARELQGLSLFAVPADTPGLQRHGLPTYDGRHSADLRLHDVQLPGSARLGPGAGLWPSLEAAIDQATALACIEAVGTMDRVLTLTKDYLQQRRQFGRPLTANQVLRHRLVDLYVLIEQSRAISLAAIEALTDSVPARRRAVSLAKAFVSPAARRCGEEGVQLHGAIGMTLDTEIGQAARRLSGMANLLGDEAWHLERLSRHGTPD
jgi:alkylation response protein AidB-like acyl-CoA dehydrogenase